MYTQIQSPTIQSSQTNLDSIHKKTQSAATLHRSIVEHSNLMKNIELSKKLLSPEELLQKKNPLYTILAYLGYKGHLNNPNYKIPLSEEIVQSIKTIQEKYHNLTEGQTKNTISIIDYLTFVNNVMEDIKMNPQSWTSEEIEKISKFVEEVQKTMQKTINKKYQYFTYFSWGRRALTLIVPVASIIGIIYQMQVYGGSIISMKAGLLISFGPHGAIIAGIIGGAAVAIWLTPIFYKMIKETQFAQNKKVKFLKNIQEDLNNDKSINFQVEKTEQNNTYKLTLGSGSIQNNSLFGVNITTKDGKTQFILCNGTNGEYIDGKTKYTIKLEPIANQKEQYKIVINPNNTDITISAANINGLVCNVKDGQIDTQNPLNNVEYLTSKGEITIDTIKYKIKDGKIYDNEKSQTKKQNIIGEIQIDKDYTIILKSLNDSTIIHPNNSITGIKFEKSHDTTQKIINNYDIQQLDQAMTNSKQTNDNKQSTDVNNDTQDLYNSFLSTSTNKTNDNTRSKDVNDNRQNQSFISEDLYNSFFSTSTNKENTYSNASIIKESKQKHIN